MILSHEHGFVFIKGVKVAGTSVEIALSRICRPNDIVTPISPPDERNRLGTAGEPRNYAESREAEAAYVAAVAEGPVGIVRLPKSPFYNHMGLVELLERIPEASAYELLFVERSPYEKVLSFANWTEHRRHYDDGGALPAAPVDVEAIVDRLIADGSILTVRNIDRYRDRTGRIGSAGWRYETLSRQLESFVRRKDAGPVELPHAKRGLDSSRLDIRTILRRDQIEFINAAFAEEFEAFGYPTV